jgi:hypothetical protein
MGQGSVEVSARQAGGSESVTDEASLADIWAAFDETADVSEYYTGGDALTTAQLAERYSLSIEHMRKIAKDRVKQGIWREVVLKSPNNRRMAGWVVVKPGQGGG